jgi:hypothetical protein
MHRIVKVPPDPDRGAQLPVFQLNIQNDNLGIVKCAGTKIDRFTTSNQEYKPYYR